MSYGFSCLNVQQTGNKFTNTPLSDKPIAKSNIEPAIETKIGSLADELIKNKLQKPENLSFIRDHSYINLFLSKIKDITSDNINKDILLNWLNSIKGSKDKDIDSALITELIKKFESAKSIIPIILLPPIQPQQLKNNIPIIIDHHSNSINNSILITGHSLTNRDNTNIINNWDTFKIEINKEQFEAYNEKAKNNNKGIEIEQKFITGNIKARLYLDNGSNISYLYIKIDTKDDKSFDEYIKNNYIYSQYKFEIPIDTLKKKEPAKKGLFEEFWNSFCGCFNRK